MECILNDMKKIYLGIIALSITGVVGYYIFSYQSSSDVASSNQTILSLPTRPAEITGYILSSIGNEIIIDKEIDKIALTEEEQAAKKINMQKLSPEERAAARELETASLKTEEVKLIIPVGIPIVKGSGDASGNVVSADIAELSKGVYTSIWTDNTGNIEYIKIKGS